MTQLVGTPVLVEHGGQPTVDGPLSRARHWVAPGERGRTVVKVALLIGAVCCAYGYTLTTLLENATMQTPLAYISLVPLIALALAAVRARPNVSEPAIHDRQLDFIIGIPLIGVAIAMNAVLPGKFSVMFWVWRIDLLSMPIFVAGAVTLIFGLRVAWRQKLAIAYLLLAWPWPYATVLLRVLDASTAITLAGLRQVLRVVPVAKPVASGDGSVFVVAHGGHTFPVSVVSACSGINGIVGFLLVGVAFAAVVRGPRVRKALWLAGGMVLLWAINLGRLTFIFWAGHLWGEDVAINVLHPVVGMVTFSIGVVIMLLAMGPFGMTIAFTGASGAGMPPPMASTGRSGQAVPKILTAGILVVVAAIVLSTADYALRSYDLVASASGEPKLLAFQSVPASPPGWRLRVSERIDWAKPLFGEDSTWTRYLFTSEPTGGNLRASYGVTADVIDTSDRETFSTYGVEACYQFHGWLLRDVAQVAIGGGITGQTMSFSGSNHQGWSVLYWIVPVKAAGGTRYERFVLYLLNTPGGAHITLPPGVHITNIAGSIGTGGPDAVLAQNRTFLIAFAHELIVKQSQRAAVVSARLPAAASGTPA